MEFLHRSVTFDKAEVNNYTPETKGQSKYWTCKGSPPPEKAKTVLSKEEVIIASVSWDSHGIILAG